MNIIGAYGPDWLRVFENNCFVLSQDYILSPFMAHVSIITS